MLGNSSPVLRVCLALGFVAAIDGPADACPLAVSLTGDSHAITIVGEVLRARGLDLDVSECEAIRAHLDERGSSMVVHVTHPDGTTIERVVDDVATAATVIESFTRTDVGDPLLATRSVPPAPERSSSPLEVEQVVPPRSPRGVRLSTAIETSFGSDRTRWMGMHFGACIMLGPICAGGRLRGASVVRDRWDDDIHRRSSELLAGIDIPFGVGGWTFTPGFAAGLGHIRTRVGDAGIESGGVRADVHATLSIPLWRRLALDVFAAADLTQETRGAWDDSGMMIVAPVEVPDEPRLLIRFGLGLSYGGL